ncbi:hypothetical protein QZH41_018171, partial [Actinostola sp. cb2023]
LETGLSTLRMQGQQFKVSVIFMLSIHRQMAGACNPLPKGTKGSLGEEGPPGRSGPSGSPGRPGPPGPWGFSRSSRPGPSGAPASRGELGNLGYSGLRGGPGQVGPKGLKGRQGYSVFPGNQGQEGHQGSRGATGDRGPPGESMSTWTKCTWAMDSEQDDGLLKMLESCELLTGIQGAKGINGEPGLPGLRGTTGLTGTRGACGEPGTIHGGGTITIKGTKGNRGTPGKRGRPGINGPAGHRGDLGNSGRPGRHGIPGRKGNTGFPGPPGTKGDAGDIANSNWKQCTFTLDVNKQNGEIHACTFQKLLSNTALHVTYQGDTHLSQECKGSTAAMVWSAVLSFLIVLETTHTSSAQRFKWGIHNCRELETKCLAYFYGSPGFPGPFGPRGPPGLRGFPGLPGSKGPKGYSGIGEPRPVVGPKGFKGHPGSNGVVGEPGMAGLKGQKGEPGSNGADAFPGEKGKSGISGIPGPKGFTGGGGLVLGWRSCVWRLDPTQDYGLTKECLFNKTHQDTVLHVVYEGSMRVGFCTTCCKRWFFTFDTKECPQRRIEAMVVGVKLHAGPGYRHGRLDGYCAVAAGSISVELWVEDCVGHTRAVETPVKRIETTSRIIIEEIHVT